MTDSAIIPVFDEIYESTYGKALAFLSVSSYCRFIEFGWILVCWSFCYLSSL